MHYVMLFTRKPIMKLFLQFKTTNSDQAAIYVSIKIDTKLRVIDRVGKYNSISTKRLARQI